MACKMLLFCTIPLVPIGESVLKNMLRETKTLVASPTNRRCPRIQLQIPVFVRGTDAAGSVFIELTKTINISAIGACIACQHPLRTNEIVQLTIPAPSPVAPSLVPSGTPPIIAKVLRKDMVGDTSLFGLEFIHPLE
ncbi:MAG: hypothetical protein DMG40_19560 [Acidobacteria bacterium]|nr:MAG: hypothetical protein DMG40_19560 [Acidobacteriota bacterium]